jgi:hypothetical protein
MYVCTYVCIYIYIYSLFSLELRKYSRHRHHSWILVIILVCIKLIELIRTSQ